MNATGLDSGIVVGVDRSQGAAAALRWAVREARSRGVPVTAVLAWDWLEQGHAIVGKDFDPSYGEAEAKAVLDDIISTAIGTDHTSDVARTVVLGLPVPSLLEAAADADLLVVGARGLGGFKSLLLGSVSQQCTHHATCPVAIVRSGLDPLPPTTERIVVGIDGSEPSQRALEWSLEAARIHNASIEVVHAWAFPYMVGEIVPAMAYDPAPYAAAARLMIDQAVESADTSGLITPVVRTVSSGGAAEAILAAAKTADLVVVGSRGRGGFAGLLLGSSSQHVVNHATCPVVVVPPSGRRSS